jgi:hypothetical protein
MENISFEGIGFNKTSLSKMTKAELAKEIGHQLSADKVEEFYKLLHGDDKKPVTTVGETTGK